MPEPIELAEAKERLGIRTAARDAEIVRLIKAAREHIEDYTDHILARRSLKIHGTGWSGRSPLLMHFRPLDGAVLTAVRRYLADGTLEAVPGAALIGDRVFPAEGSAWPSAPYGHEVEVEAGYADAADIPEQLIQAMLLLVGHWFENHEAVIVGTSAAELPLGVKDLCRGFREPGFS